MVTLATLDIIVTKIVKLTSHFTKICIWGTAQKRFPVNGMTYDPWGFATSANRFWSHSLRRPIVQPHGVKIRTLAAFTYMIDDSASFGHTFVHFNLLWLMLGMLHSDMILNLARAFKGSFSLQELVTCVNASPEACSCLVMANQPRQPAQLAPIKMFLYCLTSLSSQRGRKNSRCCMVFWKESTKNWLTESQFQGSNATYEKLADRISLFTALLPFLPFRAQ